MSAPYRPLAAAGSRVLLVGTGAYAGNSGLPDLPSVSETLGTLRHALVEHCGVRPANIGEPLLNPRTPAEIGHALVACAKDATDVLLVYYCGHGLIGADSQLCLATSETVSEGAGLGFTALPYQQLLRAVADSPAATVVVILDCCFAGRAGDPAPGTLASLASPGAPAGSYMLAAAAYSEAALAPPGEAHTAFGGALLKLLTEGIADGPPVLTLTGIYRALDRMLSAQGRPRPYSRSSGSAGELVLAANPGYHPPGFDEVLLPAGTGADDSAPYRGLAAYAEADADYFFGREKLLAALRRELTSQLAFWGPLIVLGPSGAGKSSLLRAGLRPSLDDGLPGAPRVRSWPKIVLTPGDDPLGSLASQFSGLLAADPASLRARLGQSAGLTELARAAVRRHAGAEQAGDQRLVLIVDQFEEIFGPQVDRAQRAAFLAAMEAASSPAPDGTPAAVLPVVGLRADFYGRCQLEPFLARALAAKRTFDLTPMDQDELRAVITAPAAVAGLAVEPELTDLVIADLNAEDPGKTTGYDNRLPLLSHALLATWRYRQGSVLTVRGYHAAGGISGAVGHTARQLWTTASTTGQAQADARGQALTRTERDIARRLLLELVYVGPVGTAAVRRRVPLRDLMAALGAGPGNPERMRSVSGVLGKLVSARLVTVSREHAEIVHDSLLRTWPELREWIEADRVNLTVGRQVTQAAADWDRLGRPRTDLYAGSRLEGARQWAAAARQVPVLTADFLRRSERSARARRHGVTAGVTALALALALIAVLLVVARNELSSLRAKTAALESEQLAASSNSLLSTDPELARSLALAAYRLSPTTAAAQAMADVSVTPAATEIHVGTRALSVAFGPGDLLAAAGVGRDGPTGSSGTGAATVGLWSGVGSERPVEVAVLPEAHVCALAFLPRTPILAAGCHGVTTLWNLGRPAHPVRIARFGSLGQPTDALAVSPDGRWLAIGGTKGLLELWDIANVSRVRPAGSAALGAGVSSVAFSADSRLLALDTVNRAQLADVARHAPLGHLEPVPGTADTATVAFSPRGDLLAIGGQSGLAFRDVTGPGHLKKVSPPSGVDVDGSGSAVQALAFAPDAQTVALGLLSGGIAVGTLGPPAIAQYSDAYTLPSSTATIWTAFSADGKYLAGAGADGIVRIWDVSPHPLGAVAGGFATQQSVSPDGQLAVFPVTVYSPTADDTEIWNISDPAHPVPESALPPVWTQASFIGRRTLMTASSGDTRVQLWNLANPRAPAAVGRMFTAPGRAGSLVAAASPDGALLAISDFRTITVWNIRDPADPVRWATIASSQLAGGSCQGLALFFPTNTELDVDNARGTEILRWAVSRSGVMASLPALRLPQFCQLTTAIQCGSTFIVDDAGSPVLLWDAADPRYARPAGHLDEPGNPFANTGLQSALAVLSGNDNCLLAEAANSGNTNSVEVWAARNPRAPRLVATMQTAGQVLATTVSDDGTRVAALVQPPTSQSSSSSSNTLDVWSVSPSGNTSPLAALPVSTDMEDAEFIPHSHLIPFNPPTTDEILPDILDPDPAASYRSLCSASQNVLTRKAWQHYAPDFPYESPC